MTFQVRVSKRAEQDIERNAQWWADNHSVEDAIRWFDAVHDQLRTLGEFPTSHAFSAENDEFPYEIRDQRVGFGSRRGYRAVFTIADGTVHVLAVRSCTEDSLTSCEMLCAPDAADETQAQAR